MCFYYATFGYNIVFFYVHMGVSMFSKRIKAMSNSDAGGAKATGGAMEVAQMSDPFAVAMGTIIKAADDPWQYCEANKQLKLAIEVIKKTVVNDERIAFMGAFIGQFCSHNIPQGDEHYQAWVELGDTILDAICWQIKSLPRLRDSDKATMSRAINRLMHNFHANCPAFAHKVVWLETVWVACLDRVHLWRVEANNLYSLFVYQTYNQDILSNDLRKLLKHEKTLRQHMVLLIKDELLDLSARRSMLSLWVAIESRVFDDTVQRKRATAAFLVGNIPDKLVSISKLSCVDMQWVLSQPGLLEVIAGLANAHHDCKKIFMRYVSDYFDHQGPWLQIESDGAKLSRFRPFIQCLCKLDDRQALMQRLLLDLKGKVKVEIWRKMVTGVKDICKPEDYSALQLSSFAQPGMVATFTVVGDKKANQSSSGGGGAADPKPSSSSP